MGGPATPDETGPFLHRLFNDGDIIQLGGGTIVARVLCVRGAAAPASAVPRGADAARAVHTQSVCIAAAAGS